MNTRIGRPIFAAVVLILLIGTSAFILRTPPIELRVRSYATNQEGERAYVVVALVNHTDLPVSYFTDSQVVLRETPSGDIDPDWRRTGGSTGPGPQIAAGASVSFRYYRLYLSNPRVEFSVTDLPIWARLVRKLPFSIQSRLPFEWQFPRAQKYTLKL